MGECIGVIALATMIMILHYVILLRVYFYLPVFRRSGCSGSIATATVTAIATATATAIVIVTLYYVISLRVYFWLPAFRGWGLLQLQLRP